MKCIC